MGFCVACSRPKECHIYLDGQQYFIEAVLDISRQAAAVKGRVDTYSALDCSCITGNTSILQSFTV